MANGSKRKSTGLQGKQLKARWELKELSEEQLKSFYVHYCRPIQLKDIPQLLMPKWATACVLAVMSWLGDWRPSAILEIMLGLVRYSSLSLSSSSSSFTDSPGAEQLLLQLIHKIRIEEKVIDEEMTEIQAICILRLPFGPMNIKSSEYALACVQSVFKTIERVITKAQHLSLIQVQGIGVSIKEGVEPHRCSRVLSRVRGNSRFDSPICRGSEATKGSNHSTSQGFGEEQKAC